MSVPADIPDIKPDSAAASRIIRESNRDVWMRRLKVLAPVWTLLVMWVFFSLASSSFATPVNFNNILSQVATAGILAVGMTFVLLTGEIDLSIAAVMGLSAYVSATLYFNYQLPEPIPLIAGLVLGTLCGAASGIISTVIRVPTFMATLAMSLITEGILLWRSEEHTSALKSRV